MRDPIVFVALQLVLVGVAATGSSAARATSFYECPVDPSPSPILEDDAPLGPLPISIPFYGQTRNFLYINDNGILQFGSPPSENKTVIGSFAHRNDSGFIAPLYGDFKPNNSGDGGELGDGEVTYCEEKAGSTALQRAKDDIRNFTGYKSFEPNTLIIATWNKVEYFDTTECSGINWFQCVIATDGQDMTFALFLYRELSWCSNNPVSIGFSNGTCGVWEMSCSGSEDFTALVNTSNVGTPGLWLFRIDQDIQPVCLNKTLCSDDSVCSCFQSCNHTNCQCKDSCRDNDDDDDVYCPETASSPTPSSSPPSKTITPSPTSPSPLPSTPSTGGACTKVKAEAIYIPIIVILFISFITLIIIILVYTW